MRDEADVRGVDAHPESGGCCDEVEGSGKREGLCEDWDWWGGEGVLDGDASGNFEACMVGVAVYVGGAQTGCEIVGREAERDVDDACHRGKDF